MKKLIFIACSLLLLTACAHVEPSLVHQTKVIADAPIRKSPVEISLEPRAKANKPLKALFFPFAIQQSTPEYKTLGTEFATIFYRKWTQERIFPTMWFHQKPAYLAEDAVREARRLGADVAVMGWVPYFFAGNTLDDTIITIRLDIYDAKSGQAIYSMMQSGQIEERLPEDFVYFKYETRMPRGPFHILIGSIAHDMGVPVGDWAYVSPSFAADSQGMVNGLSGNAMIDMSQPMQPPYAQKPAQPNPEGALNEHGLDDAPVAPAAPVAPVVPEGAPQIAPAQPPFPDAKPVENGNLDEQIKAEPDVDGVSLDIRFESDKDTIQPQSIGLLDDLGKALLSEKIKGKKIIIAGHTDSDADELYNLSLSKRRADKVKEFLVEKFKIEPNLIETVGYGKSRPIAPNDTPENKQKNRRVEVRLAQ